ncbi:HugZ family pyridoxamine 5'-phosphate oxidase [Alteromonas sp. CYL-A6]|uniref:HugZ family pyridoxamine 5'-phosphate oxidase n=1 Tax=Alteromonas nitratireducens TaxID=3390813 RepID=UPI0034B17C02
MRERAMSEAKLLLRQSDTGVISTISKNLQGYPFGSVTPFISDSQGNIYLYISDIAQHAKNMQADSRMSLTVFRQGEHGDQNEQARVTLVGDGNIVDGDKHDEVLARYIRRYPDAKSYEQAHDFNIWKITVKRIRYIGGFGKIFWLEQQEWVADEAPWDAQAESGIIEHMNDDHQDAMTLILRQATGILDEQVVMSGILADGCYLYSQGKNHFIPFNEVCRAPGDARKALVALTQAARAA